MQYPIHQRFGSHQTFRVEDGVLAGVLDNAAFLVPDGRRYKVFGATQDRHPGEAMRFSSIQRGSRSMHVIW
jgi:hypothetical protein